jgi:hypothetical protein
MGMEGDTGNEAMAWISLMRMGVQGQSINCEPSNAELAAKLGLQTRAKFVHSLRMAATDVNGCDEQAQRTSDLVAARLIVVDVKRWR